MHPWYKVYYKANGIAAGHLILRAPFAKEAKRKALVILANDNELRFFDRIDYVKTELYDVYKEKKKRA